MPVVGRIYASSIGRLVSKAVFLLIACVFLLPLYGSEARGPCDPRLSFVAHEYLGDDGTLDVDVVVENQGTGSCSTAYLSLYYPDGVGLVRAEPEPKAHPYFWSFASVGAGEKFIIKLTLSVSDRLAEPLILSGALSAGDQDSEAEASLVPSRPVPPPHVPSTASGATLCNPLEEKGMWVWNTPRGTQAAWRTKVLATMVEHGFNTAYIDGSELWALNGEPEPRRTTDLAEFTSGLRAFVQAARTVGVGVEVTFGHRDWGEPENRWKPLMITDKVLEYNASVPAVDRVCGVQSDIESYLMESYEQNKAVVLGNYLETMDRIAQKVASTGTGTSLGIVIPHFYDPIQAWTPPITRGNVTQSAYAHVLDLLSQVHRSSVSIMAYRNFLEGDNGVLELVTPEFLIAKERNTSTRVIVAQEVGCGLDPAWVSWCGSTKATLEDAFSFLRALFTANPSFGGFAVNYIDPYIDLTD